MRSRPIVSLVQLDGDIVTSVHAGLFARCPEPEAQQRLLQAHLAALRTSVQPLLPPDALLAQVAAFGAAGLTALGAAAGVAQWLVAGVPWWTLLERAALVQAAASAPLALRGRLRPMALWLLRRLARREAARWRAASIAAAQARLAARAAGSA